MKSTSAGVQTGSFYKSYQYVPSVFKKFDIIQKEIIIQQHSVNSLALPKPTNDFKNV